MSQLLPQRVTEPFTAAQAHQQTGSNPLVQVLISQTATCARVKHGWIARDGTFLWSLDLLGPFHGSGSFPERLVRQCSGIDDTCRCAGELAQANERARLAGPRLVGANSQAKDHLDSKVISGEVAVTPHLSLKNETKSPFCYTSVTSAGALT